MGGLPLQAVGSINPMSFVTIQGSFGVRQCTSGDYVIGVSQIGFDRPPGLINLYPNVAASYTDVAAVSGEELQINSLGDVCPVRLSTAGTGCAAGDLLCPDNTGAAIVAAGGANTQFGGRSFQVGLAGEIVQALVYFGKS